MRRFVLFDDGCWPRRFDTATVLAVDFCFVMPCVSWHGE
jgi:hypothetical protein